MDINIRNDYPVPISGGLWEIATKNQSPPLQFPFFYIPL